VGEWLKFYRPFFPTEQEALSFVESCESSAPPAAKIMIRQAQRLVTLADDTEKIRPHHEALKILFLMRSILAVGLP